MIKHFNVNGSGTLFGVQWRMGNDEEMRSMINCLYGDFPTLDINGGANYTWTIGEEGVGEGIYTFLVRPGEWLLENSEIVPDIEIRPDLPPLYEEIV
jgi:hypothetical protein